MASEGYHCVCRTCDESAYVAGRDAAQEFFNEHAERGCEVALRSVSSRRRLADNGPAPSETEAGESSSTAE